MVGFLAASRKAKQILLESDAEWERLRPLMKAKDDKTFVALRNSYRRGVPTRWGEPERQDARRLFDVLAEVGGVKLVGKSAELQPGTFWAPYMY